MHKGFGARVHFVIIHPYLLNIIGEVITDSACCQITFEINQGRGFSGFTGDANFIPQATQIIIVALQGFQCLVFTCCADNQAHVVRYFQLLENLFHRAPFFIRKFA